jgi:hypothetical protein
VNGSGRKNKLTWNMDSIGYIWASDNKIDKVPNKMMIERQMRERITIKSAKLDIELHRSLTSVLISKNCTSKEIMHILILGDIKSIVCGKTFNPKKVSKRTKTSDKKLLTKMSLTKGNVLKVITDDDHVINIEDEKSPLKRRSVNKQHGFMSAG